MLVFMDTGVLVVLLYANLKSDQRDVVYSRPLSFNSLSYSSRFSPLLIATDFAFFPQCHVMRNVTENPLRLDLTLWE